MTALDLDLLHLLHCIATATCDLQKGENNLIVIIEVVYIYWVSTHYGIVFENANDILNNNNNNNNNNKDDF